MLHFAPQEFAARRAAACREMQARGLDALLIFRQESMYYLTGYDTFGYVFFQCLMLRADGWMTLLTRRPDLEQARLTSVIRDVRVWIDRQGADPSSELRAILAEHGLADRRLGAEFEAYGLTGRSCMNLIRALDGFATLIDASDLVSRLRLVKSDAELGYVRQAARLADLALDAAHDAARPGAEEADVLAAMQGAVLAGGGDYPANPFIIGSGEHATLCRYASGRRALSATDQLMLEFAGVYRHYHACLMRTICIGKATDAHRRMHAAAAEAMSRTTDAFRPGAAVGDAYEAHRAAFDEAGFGAQRMNACGYSLGATFAPNWMDVPMIHEASPVVIEPGMVFFLHMILIDGDARVAMAPGQTILTTDAAPEVLSQRSLDLVVAA